MKPTYRMYACEEDFWRVRQFLREVTAANGLREFSWPAMRWDYWRWHGMININPFAPLEEIVFLWETADGRIAAVLNPENPGDCFMQIHPEFKTAELEAEMIALAEEKLSRQRQETRRVALWSDSKDEQRQKLLMERGFRKSGERESQWRRKLDTPIPPAAVAPGYTIRALGEASELPARSWASWRGFHPNEPAEKYQGWEWYLNIQRCPLYRRDLDIVAVAADGTIASFCTFWFDDVVRKAYIEPVATVPEHLRKGLARATITEGLRRVQRLGAVEATVGGMEDGPDALYSSVLSPEHDRYEQWVKEW